MWSYVNTDDRKLVALRHVPRRRHSEFGPHFFDASPSLTFRPMPSLSVSGGFRFGIRTRTRSGSPTRNAPGSRRTTSSRGSIRTTVALTTRVNYTMSPTLSLQIYAEPFVSAGEYTNYKELVDGRAEDWQSRYAPYAYAGNADFNFRSFRTTNVLRWEYRPGSSLFVVWQQGRKRTSPSASSGSAATSAASSDATHAMSGISRQLRSCR